MSSKSTQEKNTLYVTTRVCVCVRVCLNVRSSALLAGWHLLQVSPDRPGLCNDWGPVVCSHFLWESCFTDVSSAAQTDWSRAACLVCFC